MDQNTIDDLAFQVRHRLIDYLKAAKLHLDMSDPPDIRTICQPVGSSQQRLADKEIAFRSHHDSAGLLRLIRIPYGMRVHIRSMPCYKIRHTVDLGSLSCNQTSGIGMSSYYIISQQRACCAFHKVPEEKRPAMHPVKENVVDNREPVPQEPVCNTVHLHAIG